MTTEKLAEFVSLIRKAYDVSCTMTDEELDILADTEGYESYDFISYTKGYVESMLQSILDHPGFPDHEYKE